MFPPPLRRCHTGLAECIGTPHREDIMIGLKLTTAALLRRRYPFLSTILAFATKANCRDTTSNISVGDESVRFDIYWYSCM